jgi:hypothetical protein
MGGGGEERGRESSRADAAVGEALVAGGRVGERHGLREMREVPGEQLQDGA